MGSQVEVDGTTYHELDDNTYADAPYSVRVEVGRELSADEAERLAGLVGYAYAKTGGERGNGFHQDSPNSIIYYCDTTKGRAYRRLDQFFDDVKTFVVEGSPQRKTKNMTRLLEGLGDVGGMRFFADNVFVSQPKPTPPEPIADPKGIYKVDDNMYRVGKTGRTAQLRDGKWRALGADAQQDAYSRVKARGKRPPISEIQDLGRSSGVCLACGRALSDAASQARGMGAKCYREYGGA